MKWNAREVLEQQGTLCSFSLSEEFAPIEVGGEQLAFIEPVTLWGEAVADEREDVHVMATLSAKLHVVCARCLEAFDFAVEAKVGETFNSKPDPQDSEAMVYTNDTLVFDGLVEQIVRLELPIALVCDATCKGLCPVCGKNRNTEPCDC